MHSEQTKRRSIERMGKKVKYLKNNLKTNNKV